MASAQLFLNGSRVNAEFRDTLLDAANRAGMSVNEFVITAAAKELARRGVSFPCIFAKGDLDRYSVSREAA